MESGEVEALIECLVANPHDEGALARAHEQGEVDPQGYAYLLEQVGTRTEDPSYASHWLSEAANIWSVTLGDAHRAARVLMIAVDRDPTQPLAANRLAQLYRDKGDVKALVAMLDRRVKLLTPLLTRNPPASDDLRSLVAGLHEELGKLWNDPPLDQPRKAIDHFRRSIEIDPTAAFAIFSAREIFKSLQQWNEALTMFTMELGLERDPARRQLLLRDEAATRRLAGDATGATRALRAALDELRADGGDDPALAQEIASSILERAEAREPVDDDERAYAADLLATLAASFGGEHGVAYATGALDLVPGHDRAMELLAYYLSGTTNEAEADALSLRYHAYVDANPNGPLAKDARLHLAASYESLGQVAQAAQVLEPLRGDATVDERLAALGGGARADAPPEAEVLTSVGLKLEGPSNGAASDSAQFAEVELVDTEEVAEVGRGSLTEPGPSPLVLARAKLEAGDKAGALERYLEVLAKDPVEPEALSWVEDYLRTKREYGKLREVLWASARAATSQDSVESRKLRLREIAGLSESNLKDLDGAVQAWRQILSLDRGDDGARQALVRALEKGQRWDDLANTYEQEASASVDVDVKIQLEKKLATLHEQKRGDLVAAGEAWGRIAQLTPDDDHAIVVAADLFEKAGRKDLAAGVLHDFADGVTAAAARAGLLTRLGELKKAEGDHAAAGRAFERAATAEGTRDRWRAAEDAFVAAESWALAASAAEQTGSLASEGDRREEAAALARSSGYLKTSGDEPGSITRLERAAALAPEEDSYALALLDHYRASGELEKLAKALVARADRQTDPAARVAGFREAAKVYEQPKLSDPRAAKAEWEKVLAAGEDEEALEHLVGLALGADELPAAATLLRRLGALASTPEAKARLALREASVLAETKDVAGAIERYEWLLREVDPSSTAALRAIADLEEERGDSKAAAAALERELALTTAPPARRLIAERLLQNYDNARDSAGMFSALTVMRASDPEDFETLNRLVSLAEKLDRFEPLVDLLAEQIDVEADETEIAALTLKRARLLADKLGRGDEALAALQELADSGDAGIREAYVDLGDRLGWRGIVATKLVDWWFPAPHSEARTRALKSAFERFAQVGRDGDAVRVGIEVLRVDRDATLSSQLEELAVKAKDEVGLTAAQEVLGADLSGAARAAELVRQAEMRVRAGMAVDESVQHGESGLGGLSRGEVEPLLLRLTALIPSDAAVVDLYERQVSRARGGEAREKALLTAARVAGERGALARARGFFDLAISGSPSEASLDALEVAAREGDGDKDGLRRALAEALAAGGEGVRDGGRSRASFLRRAALLADRELHDVEQAFTWLADALVAHADNATLDALGSLVEQVKDPKRIDDIITRVLTEVFDGPLVRLLLARRVKIRRELLGDRTGAATDLKKLHDLSPTDEAVTAELSSLLTELGDHRAMIQLYEDQILRSKDQAVRAELGRKVAQIWESLLADPREAADAWRRVLRLKPGDEEATQGLDRAKTNMLRKGPPPADAATPVPVVQPTVAPEPPIPPPPPSSGRTVSVADAANAGAKPLESSEALPVPEPASSVVDVEDLDLEPDNEPFALTPEPPHLEKLLGSTDPFADVDNTHTSIDVRSNLAAATLLENGRASTAGPPSTPASSRRPPPPLPTPYETNEPPTSPGRRLDAPSLDQARRSPSDRAFAMTDENAAVDFSDQTMMGKLPDFSSEPPAAVPPDILSSTDLAALDDDDAENEVLVVDEFVEDADDEYEDVAEPSKPHGPLPQ